MPSQYQYDSVEATNGSRMEVTAKSLLVLLVLIGHVRLWFKFWAFATSDLRFSFRYVHRYFLSRCLSSTFFLAISLTANRM